MPRKDGRNMTSERRVAAGLCQDCGQEPAMDDSPRGPTCAAEHRAEMQDMRREWDEGEAMLSKASF